MTNDSGFLTSHQDLSGYVPRSGGTVLDGIDYARTVDNSYTRLYGGTGEGKGAYIQLSGNNAGYAAEFARIITGRGVIYYFENSNFAPSNHAHLGEPNYKWGQIYSTNSTISTSDVRLKNSVKDIDDNLLDAWESIEPKQYKFNDATESKGETARFHTGYLAQYIEKACNYNNIDATRYGLFCYDSWEEEPEITEDVEVEKDGVKTTEKRIIQPKREKGDAYSLRYEEALVVECAYLRREIKKLKEELNQLKTK